MSDSDSDDGFFEAMKKVGTRIAVRKAEITSEERLAALDTVLEAEEKNRQLQTRILKMKKEEPSEDCIRQAEDQLKPKTTTAQRRQETFNNIHGIAEDVDDRLTDDHRMALLNADDTEKSSLLGTRTMLSYVDHPAELYNTSEDAIKALKGILKRKELRNDAIGKRLALAFDNDALTAFLLRPTMIGAIMKKCSMTHLPHDICQWLFYLACSWGNKKLGQLPLAAFRSLEYIWANTCEPAEDPVLVLADLEAQLRNWYGLTVREKASALSDDYRDDDRDDDFVKNAISSLGRWLTLWGILFRNALVTGTENFAEMATRCIVALVQVGFDPRTIHTSGQRLLRKLRCTLHELVNFVALSMEEEEWNNWIRTTAIQVLAPIPSFGPGTPESDNSDDGKAYLCLSLAVRLFRDSGKSPLSITQFEAALTGHAVRVCTGTEHWNDETLSTIMSKDPYTFVTAEQLSLDRWTALLFSCETCFNIHREGDTLLLDGPRILATAELITEQLCVGMRLFSAVEPVEGCGIYGSKVEAGQVSQLLFLVEEQCTALAKEMGRLSSQAHFRRAECCFTNLRSYCRHVKEDAIRVAGTAVPKKVQASIDRFFCASTTDDDDEESQDILSQSRPEHPLVPVTMETG